MVLLSWLVLPLKELKRAQDGKQRTVEMTIVRQTNALRQFIADSMNQLSDLCQVSAGSSLRSLQLSSIS